MTAKLNANVAADRRRDAIKKRQRELVLESNEIQPLPAVVDKKRKASGRRSLQKFCEIYFGPQFPLKWSPTHITLLKAIQQKVKEGGTQAIAMPRGSGKTTILVAAAIWSILYGYRKFVMLICVSDPKAQALMETMQSQLRNNELLLEDFPEVCYPIRRLNGRAVASHHQTLNGKHTYIGWSAKRMILPMVMGKPSSQAIVQCAGITSGDIRGAQYTRKDTLQTIRPDFALLDDPQDDEVAMSPAQCEKRSTTIKGAVMGMSGPDVAMSAFMCCTVIREGDLSSSFLNVKHNPQWQGMRIKMMETMPSNVELWDNYKRILSDEFEAGGNGKQASAYYKKNRKAMDKGSKPTWPERVQPGTASAVETAMRIFLLTPMTFASEYQNDPMGALTDDLDQLTVEEICVKTLPQMQRGRVPLEMDNVVAYIDVQGKVLYYVVVASGANFTSHVVDYGTWPKQDGHYYSLASIRRTLATQYLNDKTVRSRESRIYAGLTDLVTFLFTYPWRREDGTEFQPSFVGIDQNWGPLTDTVKKFCRESEFRSRLIPMNGRYYGAASIPLNTGTPQKGETRGMGMPWRMLPLKVGGMARNMQYDTNYFKTFTHARFVTGRGEPGCLTLFHMEPAKHKMFAEQQHAETSIEVIAGNRRVQEWSLRPERPDNHFFDCLSGCWPLFSRAGIRWTPGMRAQRAMRRKEGFKRKARAERAAVAKEKEVERAEVRRLTPWQLAKLKRGQ